MAGRNRAINESATFSATVASISKPCIFISHKLEDKTAAIAVANYLMKEGDLDVFIDVNDKDLQAATARKDPDGVTRYIEKGISKSTHMLCLVSDKTKTSWWVPYELGYAKRAEVKIATLKLKGSYELPDYLKVCPIWIIGIKSLNKYIAGVSLKSSVAITASLEHLNESRAAHPLDQYLDRNS